MFRFVLLTAAFLASLVLAMPILQAGEPDDKATAFNSHVDRAMVAKKNGNLEESLRQLELALLAIRTLSGADYDEARIRALYQKGLVLVALKRWEEARSILRTVELSPGLNDKARQVVRERLAAVTEEINRAEAQQRPVEITVEVSNISGAVVSVDGREVGRTPLVFKRRPGTYRVEVARVGFRSYSIDLAVESQKSQVLRVTLEPEASLTQFEKISIGLGALGAALLGAGVGLHVVGNEDINLADEPGQPWLKANQTAADGELKRTAGFVMYGLAGATLVTMAVMLATDPGNAPPPAPERPRAPAISLIPTPSGAMFGAVGRF